MSAHPDQDLLLCETHHRMMNTLAFVAGSLRREFAPFRDASVRAALTRHEQMIAAFGELHGCLTVGSRRNAGALPDYLDRLCTALNQAVLEPLGIRCTVIAERGLVPAYHPERLGLIVAELVTNAAKHAFNGRPGGLVTVRLGRKAGRWRCSVSDDGTGLGQGACGVGAELVETLVHAIGATLSVETGEAGTSFHIDLGPDVDYPEVDEWMDR